MQKYADTPDSLANKNVLISGASSGIGAAVARKFAARGANVMLHFNSNESGAREVASSIENAGGHARIIGFDLRIPKNAALMVESALLAFGRLDVLVNNAGTMLGRVALSSATAEHYRELLQLNVESVFVASQIAANAMSSNSYGVIINTGSIAARFGGAGGAGLYASSKGCISTLTRSFAREFAEFNIRVNAVSPGTIATPFHERYTTDEALESVRATIPMQRLGKPEDCVGAYEFLADDSMSSYVTGQIIEVNGGQLMG